MPELPEVHTTATMLNKLIKGLVISDAWTSYKSAFHAGKENIKNPQYFAKFRKEIAGEKIVGVARRGKNVLIHLEGNKTLLIHMKMTGHLLYGSYFFEKGVWKAQEKGPLQENINQHIRLVFSFTNRKHLAFSDVRKFAKVCLLKTDELEKSADVRELGPEPLEKSFTSEIFIERLSKRPNAKIKQALLDQTLIAGIGNIYSDESLWLAGIHPETPVRKIKEPEMKKLFEAVKTVLKKGIDFQGDSTSDYRNPHGEAGAFHHKHNAYRRTDERCMKNGCAGVIARKIVAGRSAHFCATHQKGVE